MPGAINSCCKPVDPCCVTTGFGIGFGHNRFSFVLVLFILLVIVGAAFCC